MAGLSCPTENTLQSGAPDPLRDRAEGDGGEILVFTQISMPPGSLGSQAARSAASLVKGGMQAATYRGLEKRNSPR